MSAEQSRDDAARFYRLGEVVIDRDTRVVLRDGEAIRMEPRVFALLDYLAGQNGREVPRSELVSEVWAGAHVVDEAVHRAVSMVRQALGDSARRPTYVLTTPARGYRLLQSADAVPDPEAWPPPDRNRARSAGLALAAGAGFVAGMAALALWLAVTARDTPAPSAPPADSTASSAPAAAPPAPDTR